MRMLDDSWLKETHRDRQARVNVIRLRRATTGAYGCGIEDDNALMLKYLGSKRVIVPRIQAIVGALPDVRRVCDLFAGTTRVGQALKARGLYVISNDVATYSEVLGRTFIQADSTKLDVPRLRHLLATLETLTPEPGYFTRVFCEEARYFQPHNGARIDVIRDAIDTLATTEDERAILLTSLLLSADRVDSTTGLQMAYLKTWAARSYHALALRMPKLLPGTGLAVRRDANALARELDDIDLVYVAPPYNQHAYFSNYHVWETLVRNDRPETYGVARKRVDCKTTKSSYNAKRRILPTFADLVASLRTRYLLVSFSTEGAMSLDDVGAVLRERGHVAAVALDHKRYVGAQIGIYNPQGVKVGTVSHVRNREYLFLVGPSWDVVGAAMAAAVNAGK